MFTSDKSAEAELSGKGSPETQAALDERVYEGKLAVENTLHPLADQILREKMAGQAAARFIDSALEIETIPSAYPQVDISPDTGEPVYAVQNDAVPDNVIDFVGRSRQQVSQALDQPQISQQAIIEEWLSHAA